MPWVTADHGCDIYYETHGSGPAVAFAPEFMGLTDIWRAQIEALSGSHQCVAFDRECENRYVGSWQLFLLERATL